MALTPAMKVVLFRPLSPGAPAFDPSSLGLHLWYDPSDLTTLFQSSGGTTPVASDGDPVGYLGNKGSVSSFQAVQATSGKRPLYKTGGGLSWLRGDGVDDNLDAGAAISVMTVSAFDMMVAFYVDSIGPDNVDASFYDNDAVFCEATGGDVGLHYRSTGPTLQCGNFAGASNVATQSFASATPYVARLQHSGGVLSCWLNNGTVATVASGNTTSLAGNFRLFANYPAAQFSDLRIYGMACRKTIFNSGEASNLWTWMGAKAGLTL